MNSPFEVANAIARQACGMAPLTATQWPMKDAPEPANAQTVVTPGLYEYQYARKNGLILDCHLEFEAAESQTWDCPGHPESINLVHALCNGVDIADVLCESVKDLIEEEALQSMAMDKWNSDYDKGEERWHDREAA